MITQFEIANIFFLVCLVQAMYFTLLKIGVVEAAYWLESKKRIENQLNGIVSIKELPFEVDSIRKEEFKRLNTIGIWYDINNKRFVRFPKSDKFWKSAGGKDGTRGVDDWASK